jgi:hypothetical protein
VSPNTVNATVSLYPSRSVSLRQFALWYFTTLLTLWVIAGHAFLGFEQSWAQPVVAILAAALTQILLEWVDAKATRRRCRFAGGFANFLNFLPPALISGFACSMLLYANDRLTPIIFASVFSIASKVLIRVRLDNGNPTHVFNPSNVGIVATLLLFPAVGQAPPYQFTENITGLWHWALPAVLLVTGLIVHGYATGRLPLCIAWLSAFVIQGTLRAWIANDVLYVPLMPMSSAGFILFTLYMLPDPATTPLNPRRQILFGTSVALIYASLQVMHIVFGLFLALAIGSALRGITIALRNRPARLPTAADRSSAIRSERAPIRLSEPSPTI